MWPDAVPRRIQPNLGTVHQVLGEGRVSITRCERELGAFRIVMWAPLRLHASSQRQWVTAAVSMAPPDISGQPPCQGEKVSLPSGPAAARFE